VVLEELGRAVAPVPYLGSAVLATRALLSCGETELLGQLATGARSAALAVPFSAGPGFTAGASAAVADGSLTGSVTSVADAVTVDVLLVPAVPVASAGRETAGSATLRPLAAPAVEGLYAVDATDAGVTRTPVVSLDMTRQLCDVRFDSASGRPIATGAAAASAVTAALTTGAALLASEQVGLSGWCLETTVEYLKTRYQFGRQVGSFQALKHRLADLWTLVTQARAVARHAAACAADAAASTSPASTDVEREAAIAAALAQAYCAEVAVLAAEECMQLHGGIGFTWEHPAHLYLKRAKSSAIALGTAERHRAALAGMVNIPPA
jgi:alkylation response protein AidB-like acyl-CoA dehydrogenase